MSEFIQKNHNVSVFMSHKRLPDEILSSCVFGRSRCQTEKSLRQNQARDDAGPIAKGKSTYLIILVWSPKTITGVSVLQMR